MQMPLNSSLTDTIYQFFSGTVREIEGSETHVSVPREMNYIIQLIRAILGQDELNPISVFQNAPIMQSTSVLLLSPVADAHVNIGNYTVCNIPGWLPYLPIRFKSYQLVYGMNSI